MPRHTETIEVITTDQRRRRWSLAEKAALVKRTYEPGMSVSLVARQEGVAASLLFQWRKLERQGALTAVSAGEAVVPASELAAARAEIAKLQRVLGKKTLENEILKEAVECPGTRNDARVRGTRFGPIKRSCTRQPIRVVGRWPHAANARQRRAVADGHPRADRCVAQLRL
jgi:transposase-like protein